jgi:hypothetical protein
LPEAAVFDVFRFALFAARTFFGVIALIFALYAALWVFVKIDSMEQRNRDPDAALRRVKSYNTRAIIHQDGKAAAQSPAGRNNCADSTSGCSLKKM